MVNAAINLAIKEWKLTFNPFPSIVPKRDDKQKRLPLSEADIKNVKRELGQLDKNDQLLFRLLAATGMRLSEAFEIKSELKERGCRYVIIGKKTPQSHRRVPFPAAVLPYLPKVIKGPLFEGGRQVRRNGSIDSSAASASSTKARYSIPCDIAPKTDYAPPVAPSIIVGRCLATKWRQSPRATVGLPRAHAQKVD